MFAQCEWIFWEGIGLVVGQLGVVSLSVHAIPNQTIMTFCMIPFNFGIALAIRMGVSLPVSVRRTQSIVIATTVFSLVVFGIASLVCYYSQHTIVGVFTTDPEVRALADTVWTNVSLFNFNVAIFAIFAGIATGLGKQWLLGMINFGYLWLVGFPIIYYHAIYLDEGLTAVWYWMNVPYLLMNMTLAVCFVGLDWYHIQHQIITKNTTTPATAATTNNTTTNGNTNDENNTNNNDPRHEYSQTQADDCMDDETTTLL